MVNTTDPYNLIKRRSNQFDGSGLLKLKLSYNDLLEHRHDGVFLLSELFKYYRRLYHSKFDIEEIDGLLRNHLTEFILSNNNKGVGSLKQIVDLEQYRGTEIKSLPPFKPSTSRFVRTEGVDKNRYPYILDLEISNMNNNQEIIDERALIIDLVGIYNFRPSVSYDPTYKTLDSNNMYQTVRTLRNIESVIDFDYSRISILRGDNVYASILVGVLFVHLIDILETDEQYMTNLADMVLNILTSLAYNGKISKYYARQLAQDEVLATTLFQSLLSIKGSSNYSSNTKRNSTVATKFETKKDINPGVQYLASQSVFLQKGFSKVEYDNDIDRDKIQNVNKEFGTLFDLHLIPSIAEEGLDNKFTIRFRKLGREHALGLYADGLKTVIIDNAQSLMHEYGHLIDYNYHFNSNVKPDNGLIPGSSLSMGDYFKPIRELYSSLLVETIDQETDNEFSALIQRDLDYYLLPTEIFARTFESYLLSHNIKGMFLGTDYEEKNSNWHDSKVIRSTYTISRTSELATYIEDYFSTLLGKITPEQEQQFHQVISGFVPNATTDLTEELSGGTQEYTQMTTQQRHQRILAKKYMKKVPIKALKQALMDTDAMYDQGIPFPMNYRMLLEYDANKDKIRGLRVMEKNQAEQILQTGNYIPTDTKSLLTMEQHFYELFIAQGVQQQIPINILIKNIQSVFKNN